MEKPGAWEELGDVMGGIGAWTSYPQVLILVYVEVWVMVALRDSVGSCPESFKLATSCCGTVAKCLVSQSMSSY